MDLADDFAHHLALEATLNEPLVETIIDHAESALGEAPATIADLGSGMGTGTVALARRFPTARIHALDSSAKLLEHAWAAARAADVDDRVDTHEASLDAHDWPEALPSRIDLAWSSLTMHHVTEPAATLSQVFESLAPGGIFVLTELANDARLEPEDFGTGRAGLRDRVDEHAPQHHHHPDADWQQLLVDAGFDPVTRFDHELFVSTESETGRKFLAGRVAELREQGSESVDQEDLAALDAALHAIHDGSSPLTFRSGRLVWVAVRPNNKEEN